MKTTLTRLQAQAVLGAIVACAAEGHWDEIKALCADIGITKTMELPIVLIEEIEMNPLVHRLQTLADSQAIEISRKIEHIGNLVDMVNGLERREKELEGYIDFLLKGYVKNLEENVFTFPDGEIWHVGAPKT
jgi:hypothetical protein